jgi:hypothetical protein
VTIAVPLGKTSPCGGTEYMNVHWEHSEGEPASVFKLAVLFQALTIGKIHGDFEANAKILISWFGPHDAVLYCC